MSNEAEALTGHLSEYQGLLGLLAERPGLVVVSGDPWSGTSALLAAAADSVEPAYIWCDARPCSDSVDLAMAIADSAVSGFAPDAIGWWLGSAPPGSAAGLRVAKAASPLGLDLEGLQHGAGPGPRLLSDAIELVIALDADAALVVDHLGLMLSAAPPSEAREILGVLRATLQRHPGLDLVLVEHSEGSISRALADHDHPLFRAGEPVRIRRPTPARFAGDLAVTRAWTDVPVELLGAAAELTAGVPALTWRVVELAHGGGEALSGWRRLRRATTASTERQWDLLRRVHPQAQPVVAAMAAGLRPHSVAANAKSINDALNRLRGLGVVWQPEERRWSLADPLLRSWARENAPSWAGRRRHPG